METDGVGSDGLEPSRKWVAIASVETMRDDGIVRFQIEGRQFLLIFHDGTLYACERACPHEQADLAEGSCRNNRLHCPRHQASFDLKTGLPSAGWSFRSLLVLPVHLHAGHVWVAAPP